MPGGSALSLAIAIVRALLGDASAGARLTPFIGFHPATVPVALPLGMWLFPARRGTGLHRMPGTVWTLLMPATAGSRPGNRAVSGGVSPIRIFSLWTLFPVPRAWVRIRRGNVAGHSRALRGLFGGALLIAGAFTFTPGRILTVWAPG